MSPEHHLTQALKLLQQSRQRVTIYLSQKHRPTPEEISLLQTLQGEYETAGQETGKAVWLMRVRWFLTKN